MKKLDRSSISFHPLAERENKVRIEEAAIGPESDAPALSEPLERSLSATVAAVRRARSAGRPVVLAFGAHTVKNGAAPLLIHLIESGWVTHLATNGAGIIHDWEFAFQGESSEDVRANVARGAFGIWEETGLYLNLAIAVGAFEGRGYGESVGTFIQQEGMTLPSDSALRAAAEESGESGERSAERSPERRAAALDLLTVLDPRRLGAERSAHLAAAVRTDRFLPVAHPYKEYSVQAAAFRLGVPCTAHPMFGHDIIYTHPASCGACIGRAAERDFLSYAEAVSRIQNGVYLSVGSAVMSPMIFEKSLSMARNLAIQRGESIENHTISVVDLAESAWDWARDGEPPPDDPAYYLRFMKTFNRMGGELNYLSMDNRAFLIHLSKRL